MALMLEMLFRVLRLRRARHAAANAATWRRGALVERCTPFSRRVTHACNTEHDCDDDASEAR